jgi:hypothetical protein
MDERHPTHPADTSGASFHGPAEILSSSAVGAVALCGCGHLHLNLQYITLRLEPAAFRELAVMLTAAQRRLDADGRGQGASVDALAAPVH